MTYNIDRTERIMQAEFSKCGMLRAFNVEVDCIGGESFELTVNVPESIEPALGYAQRIAENIAIDCIFSETSLVANYAKSEDLGIDSTYGNYIELVTYHA